jgi:hypothetical protein
MLTSLQCCSNQGGHRSDDQAACASRRGDAHATYAPLFNRFLFRDCYMPLARCSLQLHILPRSAARETCLHQCAALQDPSCKIRALTHVLLVAAGASALSLDRRVALRAAAAVIACPSRPAKAVLACVDGQGPWCGGLEPATNDRAQSVEAVKVAYQAELAQLVNRTATAKP